MSIQFYYTEVFNEELDSHYRDELFAVIDEMYPNSLKKLTDNSKKLSPFDLVLLGIDEANRIDLYKSQMVIIFYNQSTARDAIGFCKEKYGINLIGLVNTSDHIEVFRGVYTSILSNVSSNKLDGRISEKMLTSLYHRSLNELERIKKMHSHIVPMREEKFKNITIYSKFAAGLARGGEFFDVVDKKTSITLIVGAFESYLGTSTILKNLEALKLLPAIENSDLRKFIENFTDDCREAHLIDREYFKSVQLDVIHIDLTNLELMSFHFGLSKIYLDSNLFRDSNELALNENNFEDSYKKITLKRGERLFFFSPGTVQNFEKQKKNIQYFLQQFNKVSAKELVNESMFQIKGKSSKDFLEYDASIIFLEVGNNAITQV